MGSRNGKRPTVFKGVHRVRVNGALYVYAWRGGPKLSGDPLHSEKAAQEFLERTASKAADSTLFTGLIERFVASPEFRRRSKEWKKESLGRHDILLRAFAQADIAYFERREMRKQVLALRDRYAAKPRTADKLITELTAILNWARDRGEIGPHVAERVGKLYQADRSQIIWEPAEIEAVCAQMKPAQQAVMLLAAYTGLDLGDLCALPWSAVGTHDIQTVRGKSRHKTAQRAIIPILPEARKVLDSLPRHGPIVLTNTRGRPWTPDGYSAVFRRAKEKAGIEGKRFKDLRGTACTNFLIRGMSYAEAGIAMGWSEKTVEQMARRYVHRDRIASAAVERLANRNVKSAVKTVKRSNDE